MFSWTTLREPGAPQPSENLCLLPRYSLSTIQRHCSYFLNSFALTLCSNIVYVFDKYNVMSLLKYSFRRNRIIQRPRRPSLYKLHLYVRMTSLQNINWGPASALPENRSLLSFTMKSFFLWVLAAKMHFKFSRNGQPRPCPYKYRRYQYLFAFNPYSQYTSTAVIV